MIKGINAPNSFHFRIWIFVESEIKKALNLHKCLQFCCCCLISMIIRFSPSCIFKKFTAVHICNMFIFGLMFVLKLMGLAHSLLFYPEQASLGQRDLILWSAHETIQTWVCNFRDQTGHNSDCDVTVVFRWRKRGKYLITLFPEWGIFMILLFTQQFLTDFIDCELVFSSFSIISAIQHRRIIDEVVKEILIDSNSENGYRLPDDDPDLDESDTESGSFDKSLHLDNLI